MAKKPPTPGIDPLPEPCQGCGNAEPRRLTECPFCGATKCELCDPGYAPCQNCKPPEE